MKRLIILHEDDLQEDRLRRWLTLISQEMAESLLECLSFFDIAIVGRDVTEMMAEVVTPLWEARGFSDGVPEEDSISGNFVEGLKYLHLAGKLEHLHLLDSKNAYRYVEFNGWSQESNTSEEPSGIPAFILMERLKLKPRDAIFVGNTYENMQLLVDLDLEMVHVNGYQDLLKYLYFLKQIVS